MEVMDLLLLLEVLIEVVIFAMGVVGNLLVVIVMAKEKKLRQTSANNYIISIAIVDLITGAYAIPFFVYGFLTHGPHHYQTCIWMTSLIFMLFGISINLLVALSANRFWAVCHPTSYFAYRGAGITKWVILVCVIIGALLGIFPALGWNSGNFDGKCYIFDLTSFSYLFLCCFWTLASTAVIIVLYGLIYKSLSDHTKSRRALFADKSPEHQNHKEEIKITKTMSLVIGSFIICWMPITLNFLVVAITRKYVSSDFSQVSVGLLLLGVALTGTHLNSAIDPLIYAYRMKEVRVAIKKLLKCESLEEVESNN